MSEPDATRFTCLNDFNSAEWAIPTEAVLIRRGLWSVINIVVPNAGAKDEEDS